VTLGRALLEIGQLDKAQEELRRVLRSAPENLAALRGLAEIHHRRGELQEALAHYRTALEFARHDAELEHVIAEISEQLEPSSRAPQVVDGLSFEEAAAELLAFSGNGTGTEAPAPTNPPVPDRDTFEPEPVVVVPEVSFAQTGTAVFEPAPAAFQPEPVIVVPELSVVGDESPAFEPEPPAAAPSFVPTESDAWELGELPADPLADPAFAVAASSPAVPEAPVSPAPPSDTGGEEADRQLAALERWLEAIVADREKRSTPTT
jgi:tetratricopeptide (TPR) repeat protein